MSKITIIEGNSNDKDNVRAYMVKGERGDDGVSPTFETSKQGSVATITITDAEGTHTVQLEDGEDGRDLTGGVPTNGVIGFDGVAADIPDGYEVTTEPFPSESGGSGGTVLWTGSSDSMSEGVLVPSSADYDYVIVYCYKNGSANTTKQAFICENNMTTSLNCVDYNSGAVRSFTREISFADDWVDVGDGYINGTVTNTALCPYKIVGYKY